MTSKSTFEQLLHAAFMVQECHDSVHDHSFGKAVGEMDWVTEISRLKGEIACTKQS